MKALRECKTCKGSKTGMCCPYNISELNMALYKTKNGKSPGADTITNEMLKHTSSKAKCALLTLFNKS